MLYNHYDINFSVNIVNKKTKMQLRILTGTSNNNEDYMGKSKEQIRYNMQRIKNKDSAIELILRKVLWQRGLRYRKNVTKVYGKPDIVFPGKKVAVFCDSEFWHGYDWDNRKKDFKSNRDFWIPKIERNIQRDKEVNERLISEGWKVLRFWGSEIIKKPYDCADTIEKAVRKR